ncbi:MAG: transcription antitermination factor NusB [Actinobacteria bacterium]|nr:transcription antitermination factor NusB [Actinomycetota bacterium]
MTNKSRRKAREEAVVILYQSDLLKKDVEKIFETEILFGKQADDFTKELVLGVSKNLHDIDDKIKSVVENWALERIAIIDRNIIRVAIFEMLYIDEIPLKVSVDEAIEISKSFGAKDDTPRFVNGILGKILADIQGTKNEPIS